MVKGYKKEKFKKVEKRVIEYFFTKHNNDWKTMQKIFKISITALNRIISDELERRYNNKRKIEKENEENKRNRNKRT